MLNFFHPSVAELDKSGFPRILQICCIFKIGAFNAPLLVSGEISKRDDENKLFVARKVLISFASTNEHVAQSVEHLTFN